MTIIYTSVERVGDFADLYRTSHYTIIITDHLAQLTLPATAHPTDEQIAVLRAADERAMQARERARAAVAAYLARMEDIYVRAA